MKKNQLLWLFLLHMFAVNVVNAQDGGDITLTTQAEVDAFNFTSVTSILIQESTPGDITNLDGLSELKDALQIFIFNNSALTNVDGLIGLTGVFDVFSMSGNNALENVDGLSNLKAVTRSFSISNNASLTDVDGLMSFRGSDAFNLSNNASLTNVDGLSSFGFVVGPLTISNNPLLTNLNGLSNLSIADNLTITNNVSLKEFCGLYNLYANGSNIATLISGNAENPSIEEILAKGPCRPESVFEGDLYLTSQKSIDNFNYTSVTGHLCINEKLEGDITNLDGLSGLLSVGSLKIVQNKSLTSIDGLLVLKSAGKVEILNNSSLTNLNGLQGLDSAGSLTIKDNESLAEFCKLYPLFIGGFDGQLIVSGNLENPTREDILACVEPVFNGSLSLSSQEQIDAFNYETITGDFIIQENVTGNITNLDGLSELKSVSTLSINQNSSLTSLGGLMNLEFTQVVSVENNPSITNLDGLEKLESLIYLILRNNTSLTNLDGLSNVNSINALLVITGNTALTSFCGLYKTALTGFTGITNISGNAVNPTRNEIIADGPCSDGGNFVTDADDILVIPDEYALSRNYPNPFNPSTTISFSLPEAGFVTLNVYNSLGEVVETLVNETLNAGIYESTFKTDNLPSGIYIYRIEAGNFVKSSKMILMK